MTTRQIFGFAGSAVLLGLVAVYTSRQPAHSSTVDLQGTMDTTAVLLDNVTVHVPHGVPALVIRFPIVKSDTQNEDFAASNTQSIGKEEFACSVTPTSEKTIQDSSGNTYKEMSFKNPPPGEMSIEATVDQLDLVADLDSPMPNVKLPLDTGIMPDSVVKYLGPSQYVQSDSPDIQTLATQVVGDASTESEAANRISYWMRTHMRYGGSTRLSDTDALSAMRDRASICCGWAHLFIALSRSVGIPARFVGGYVIAGSLTYPTSSDGLDRVTTENSSLMHAWVELWYPHQGWVAYDPQSSAGFVDTHHVRLWASVDGGSTLPLVTWESVGSAPNVTFTETESASDVNDRLNVRCLGREGDRESGPIMLSRSSRNAMIASTEF